LGTEPPASVDCLCQAHAGVRVVGKGELAAAPREQVRDRRSDVACRAGDEGGRHNTTLVRLTPAVSKRWTVPRSSRRTFSPGDPANGGAALGPPPGPVPAGAAAQR